MKPKPNYFSNQQVRISQIKRGNTSYTVRENRQRFFFPDEWMAFFDCLKSRQKITFNFLINCGARISEIRGLNVSDVDYERNSLILKFTKSRNKDGSRKVRVIPISPQFSKYIRKIVNDFNLKPEDKFPILSIPAANIAMKNGLKRAGIQDWQNFSVHNVRKTLETWLLSLDIDSLKISKHLGHSIMVAAKHYVSPDTFNYEDKRLMREIIGDLYGR